MQAILAGCAAAVVRPGEDLRPCSGRVGDSFLGALTGCDGAHSVKGVLNGIRAIKEIAMISVLALAGLFVVLAWATHDRDGMDFRARDIHRAQSW
ncbi:hypothetical protein GCM10027289_30820 [Tsukamurella serpentis]